jgi:hypothetical protein
VTRAERILEAARRVLQLEGELADAKRTLDELVGGEGPSKTLTAPRARASAGRRAAAAAASDVQGVVLQAMLKEPDREFRAADFHELLPGPPGKGSVESALQRLMRGGQLERRGRGLYRATRPSR